MNGLSEESIEELMNDNKNDCLINERENKVINNNNNNNNNNKNKRSLNSNDCYYERKRFCNNEHDFDDNYDNHFDQQYSDCEEYSAYDHSILNISNRLINFSLNFVEIPEWPEFINDSMAFNNNNNESLREISNESKAINDSQFPPKCGQIFFKYSLDSLVKSDKRVAVFLGHRVDKTDEQFIVKIAIESGVRFMRYEIDNYRTLKGGKAVPKIIDYIWWKVYKDKYSALNWSLIVTEKFGINLVQLMEKSNLLNNRLPLERVFDFAVQMIDIIEFIHQKGLIHCALKPDNFVIESDFELKLYIIGLNSAKSYLIKKSDGTVEHIEFQRDTKLPKGDPNYHSIGYHNGIRRSRRDDMESIGYCFVYLAKGSLPWISGKNKDSFSAKTIRQIGKRMQETSLEELCYGLPQNFIQYFELISHQKFKDKPNYEELRQCFRINS